MQSSTLSCRLFNRLTVPTYYGTMVHARTMAQCLRTRSEPGQNDPTWPCLNALLYQFGKASCSSNFRHALRELHVSARFAPCFFCQCGRNFSITALRIDSGSVANSASVNSPFVFCFVVQQLHRQIT